MTSLASVRYGRRGSFVQVTLVAFLVLLIGSSILPHPTSHTFVAAQTCVPCDMTSGEPLYSCATYLATGASTRVFVPSNTCGADDGSLAITAKLSEYILAAATGYSPTHPTMLCSALVPQFLCAYVLKSTSGSSTSSCTPVKMCQYVCNYIKKCLYDQTIINCVTGETTIAVDNTNDPTTVVSGTCVDGGVAIASTSTGSVVSTTSSSSTGAGVVRAAYASAKGIAIPTAIVSSDDASDITDLSATTLNFFGRNSSGVGVYKDIPYMDAVTARWSQPIPASVTGSYLPLVTVTSTNIGNKAKLRALGVSSTDQANAVNYAFPDSDPSKICYQRHPTDPTKRIGSEDCLYMNIVTPYLRTDASNYTCVGYNCTAKAGAPPLLPVMLFFHGGNYANGSMLDIDGEALVLKSVQVNASIVVVSFNYRLGVFGFLAHKGLSYGRTPLETSGNYAFEDQRLALTFVRAHIHAFGGDPLRITVVGEGSGAVMACMHLFADPSDTTTNLFQQAILQDGSCANIYRTLATSEAVGAIFAAKLSVKLAALSNSLAADCLLPAASLVTACLRSAGTSTLYDLYLEMGSDRYLDTTAPQMLPLIDGSFYADYMGNNLLSLRFLPIPVIFGSSTMELAPFIGGKNASSTTYYNSATPKSWNSHLGVFDSSVKGFTLANLTKTQLSKAAVALVNHAANDDQPFLPSGAQEPPKPTYDSTGALVGGAQYSTLWSGNGTFTVAHLRQDSAGVAGLYSDPTLDNYFVDILTSLYTDYAVTCPNLKTANALRTLQFSGAVAEYNVYLYRFSYQSLVDPAKRFQAAVAGSGIMPYLTGSFANWTTNSSQIDIAVSAQIQYRWFNFLYYGDPTPITTAVASSLLEIPVVLATDTTAAVPLTFQTWPVYAETRPQLGYLGSYLRISRATTTLATESPLTMAPSSSSSQDVDTAQLITECQVWAAVDKPARSDLYYSGRKTTGAEYTQFSHCEALSPTSYCYGILSYTNVNIRGPFACQADVEHFLSQLPPIVAALNSLKVEANYTASGLIFQSRVYNSSWTAAQTAQYCIDNLVFATCRLLYRPCVVSYTPTTYDITTSNSVSGSISQPCGHACHNYRFACPLNLATRLIQPVFNLYLPDPLKYSTFFTDCTDTTVWNATIGTCNVNLTTTDLADPVAPTDCSCVSIYGFSNTSSITPSTSTTTTSAWARQSRTLMATDSNNNISSTGTSSSSSSSLNSDAYIRLWQTQDQMSVTSPSPGAPSCVAYNGTVCGGILNYNTGVYVPAGSTLAAMEASALSLVPLQLLATISTGCRESFARHTCATIFRPCDLGAQKRAAATLNAAGRWGDAAPYPRNPCKFICTDALSQCKALFAAAPQAAALVKCDTQGIFSPNWTLCADPELYPSRYSQVWVVPYDYPPAYNTPPTTDYYPNLYAMMQWATNVGSSALDLSVQCNDYASGINHTFSTLVSISCPYPLVVPDNPKASTYAGGSCALPCSSVLWTDQQWGYGDTFFLVCVAIGFVSSLWLFVSYTLFPVNRARHYLHMFFVSTFLLTLIYVLQIGYSGGKAHTFGCKNNSEISRQSDQVLCTLAGASFIYFINASVQWWMVISLDLFNSLVRKKKYNVAELAWQRRAYHAIAWGMPVIFVIIAAGQQALGRTKTLPWCFMTEDTSVGTEWGIMWVPLLARLLLGMGFMFRVAHTMYQQGSIVERSGTGDRWGWFKMQAWLIALVVFFCLVFLWLVLYRFYMLLNSAAFDKSLDAWIQCLIYARGNCGEKPAVYPVSLLWYGMIGCVGAQGIACGLFFGFERRNFVLWSGFFQGKGRDYFTKPDVDSPSRAEANAKWVSADAAKKKNMATKKAILEHASSRAIAASQIAIEMTSVYKQKGGTVAGGKKTRPSVAASRRSAPKETNMSQHFRYD